MKVRVASRTNHGLCSLGTENTFHPGILLLILALASPIRSEVHHRDSLSYMARHDTPGSPGDVQGFADKVNRYSMQSSSSYYFGDFTYPFQNPDLPWDERVDDLVSRLTLEEIQLQMARGGQWAYSTPAPAIPRLGEKQLQFSFYTDTSL